MPSFTFRPSRALKYSILSQHGLRRVSMECLCLVTMSGPCLAQFYIQTSTEILKAESIWYKAHVYGVSSQRPYPEHVGTMFVLTLLLDELEH